MKKKMKTVHRTSVTIGCTCCVLISIGVDMVRVFIVIGIVHRMMILVIVMIRFIDCFAVVIMW